MHTEIDNDFNSRQEMITIPEIGAAVEGKSIHLEMHYIIISNVHILLCRM